MFGMDDVSVMWSPLESKDGPGRQSSKDGTDNRSTSIDTSLSRMCALDECRIMLKPLLIEMKFEVLSVVTPYLLRLFHKFDQCEFYLLAKVQLVSIR